MAVDKDPTPPLSEEGRAELAADIPEVHDTPAVPDRLSPALAFDMGRRSIQLEQSESIDQYLGEQREVYKNAPRELLVQALVDRDRVIAQMGRMLSDGKMATNLLREFVRGQLAAMDRGTPEALQRLLEDTFGKVAMHADARQIAKHGHTLGPSIDQKMNPEQHAIDTAPTVPRQEIVQHTPSFSMLDAAEDLKREEKASGRTTD